MIDELLILLFLFVFNKELVLLVLDFYNMIKKLLVFVFL